MADLEFQVGFNVDKAGLSTALSNISSAVKKLGSTQGLTSTTFSPEAIESAQKMRSIIGKSWDISKNEINMKKFTAATKESYGSVESMKTNLESFGRSGVGVWNQVASSVMSTNMKLKGSNEMMNNLFKTMSSTARWSISNALLQGFAGTIQKSFYYVKDLDKSLNDIRVVTGKSSEEMASFAVSAQVAAKSLGESTLDYAKAALIYYQQGISSQNELQNKVSTTSMVSNVTGLDTDSASSQLTAVWNGYRVGAEEATSYIDKLAKVAAISATDLQYLSTAMSKNASVANALGVPIDKLNAMLATTGSVTQQAAEGTGTAYKTIFARLADLKVKGSADEFGVTLGTIAEQMSSAGIEILDAKGNLKDLGNTVEEVGDKWQGWTKAQKDAVAIAMAGKRQYNNLVALFDNWDDYHKYLDASTTSLGTLQKQQDIYMDSTKAHLESLSAETERTSSLLFSTDAIKGVADATDGVLTGYNNYLEGYESTFGRIMSIVMSIAMVFNTQISKSIMDIQKNWQTTKQNKADLNTVANVTALSQASQTNPYFREPNLKAYEMMQASNGEVISTTALEAQSKQMDNLLANRKQLTTEEYNEGVQIAKNVGLFTQRAELIEQAKNDFIETSKGNMDPDQIADSDVRETSLRRSKQEISELKKMQSKLTKVPFLDATTISGFAGNLKALEETGREAGGNYSPENLKKVSDAMKSIYKDNASFMTKLGVSESQMATATEGTVSKVIAGLQKAKAEAGNAYSKTNLYSGKNKDAIQKDLIDSYASNTDLYTSMGLKESDFKVVNKSLVDKVVNAMDAQLEKLPNDVAKGIKANNKLDELGTDSGSSEAAVEGGKEAIANLVEEAKQRENIQKTMMISLVIAQSMSSVIGGWSKALDKTASAAERANGVLTATSGILGAAGGIAGAVIGHGDPTAMMIGSAVGGVAGQLVGMTGLNDVLEKWLSSAKEAQDKIDETVSISSNSQNTYRQQKASIAEISEEYKSLAAQAGTYGGNLANMTDAQQARYHELTEMLTGYNEDAILTYDSQGNAIVNNNTLLENTLKITKDINEEQKNGAYESPRDFEDTQISSQKKQDKYKQDNLDEAKLNSTVLAPSSYDGNYGAGANNSIDRAAINGLKEELEFNYGADSDLINGYIATLKKSTTPQIVEWATENEAAITKASEDYNYLLLESQKKTKLDSENYASFYLNNTKKAEDALDGMTASQYAYVQDAVANMGDEVFTLGDYVGNSNIAEQVANFFESGITDGLDKIQPSDFESSKAYTDAMTTAVEDTISKFPDMSEKVKKGIRDALGVGDTPTSTDNIISGITLGLKYTDPLAKKGEEKTKSVKLEDEDAFDDAIQSSFTQAEIASDSFNKAINSIDWSAVGSDEFVKKMDSVKIAMQEAVVPDTSSLVSGMDLMSESVTKLQKAYDSLINSKETGVGLDAGALTALSSIFQNSGDYNAYIEAVTQTGVSTESLNAATTNVLESLIDEQGILDNLTKSNSNAAVEMLENMGVTNASAYVNYKLEQSIISAKIATMDTTRTIQQNTATMVQEGLITNEDALAYQGYAIEKVKAQISISTASSIDNLTNEMAALGIVTKAYADYYAAKRDQAALPAIGTGLFDPMAQAAEQKKQAEAADAALAQKQADMIAALNKLKGASSAKAPAIGLDLTPPTASKSGSGSGSNAAAAKEFTKSYDEFAEAVKNAKEKVDDLNTTLSNNSSYTDRIATLKLLNTEQSNYLDSLNKQEAALKLQYESDYAALPEEWRTMVSDSSIPAETTKQLAKTTTDESMSKLVDAAIESRDAWQDAGDTIIDVTQTINESLDKSAEELRSHYATIIDTIGAELSALQSETSLNATTGEFITVGDYKDQISEMDDQISSYEDTIDSLQDSMDEIDDVDDDEYIALNKQLADAESSISGLIKSQAELNETIKQMPVSIIDNFENVLANNLTDIDNAMKVLEARGLVTSAKEYEAMISLSKEQSSYYEQQLTYLNKLLKTYDEGSDKWYSTITQIQTAQTALSTAEANTYGWNKAILELPLEYLTDINDKLSDSSDALNDLKDDYDAVISAVSESLQKEMDDINDVSDDYSDMMDDKIEALQDELDLLNDTNDARSLQLALSTAQYDLEEAQRNKTTKVIRNGQVEYEQSAADVRDAQSALDDATFALAAQKLQDEIDALGDEKDDQLEIYSDQVDALQDIADAWSEIVSNIDLANNSLTANNLLGSGWLDSIMGGSEREINYISDNYSTLVTQLDGIDDTTEAITDLSDVVNGFVSQWEDGSLSYDKALAAITNATQSTIGDKMATNNSQVSSLVDYAANMTAITETMINQLNSTLTAIAKPQSSGGSSGSSGSKSNWDDSDSTHGPGIYHEGIELGAIGDSSGSVFERLQAMATHQYKEGDVPIIAQAGEAVLTAEQQKTILDNFKNLSQWSGTRVSGIVNNNVTTLSVTYGDLSLPNVTNGEEFSDYIATNLQSALIQKIGEN